jgi:hypothetical protein
MHNTAARILNKYARRTETPANPNIMTSINNKIINP